jgi:hypothetical protein
MRILTPQVVLENVEALKEDKPFLMRAELELGARFIQAVALPTLVDMLGFSGGGGAPAYGFLVETSQLEQEQVLFISLAPGAPFYLPTGMQDNPVYWSPLGITQSMGALLTHFFLRGPGIGDIVKSAESEGAVVVDMLDYQIPELLQKKILPGRIAQAVKP